MGEYRKIAPNVLSFLNSAAAAYAKMKEEEFAHHAHADLWNLGVSSPIEDLFFIALKLQCANESIVINPNPEDFGLFLTAQARIDRYRVDFLITYRDIKGLRSPVVVELDGHDFHDKDKYQRSYEKARDRYLVKNGYRVIHFTGSDVNADPHKAVYEALSLLEIPEYDKENVDEFDPNDRLGRFAE